MRQRAVSGAILVAIFGVCLCAAEAWTLRLVLAGGFAMAMFEIFVAVAWRRLSLSGQGWRRSSRDFVVLQLVLLAVAGLLVVVRPIGAMELLAVMIAAYTADFGGLMIGGLYGKTRMIDLGYRLRRARPWSFAGEAVLAIGRTSPKKTLEGYVGGLVISGLAMGGFLWLAVGRFAVRAGAGLWLFGGVIGFVGDLLGSATKRGLGMKDSGEMVRRLPLVGILERLLDGHGGFLDRFDSLCLVFIYYYLLLCVMGAL